MRPLGQLSNHDLVGLPLLVGREREQRLLQVQLADVLAGHGRLVLVAGEAGVGKTTLVDALATEATARGALAITGHCYDLTATPPYGPWIELFERYRSPADVPALPEFLHDSDIVGSASGQAAFFTRIRGLLSNAATTQPLLLVLEDLNWSDPASLELLRFVGQRLNDMRLLLVVTYRADELSRNHPLYQLLPFLVREAQAERIDLRPLGDDAVLLLLARRYGLPAADASWLGSYVQEHVEGNPFLLNELLRTLEERGFLSFNGGSWRLDHPARVPVPTLVRQVIEGRLARIGTDAREIIEAAAVIGHEVPLELWRSVVNVSEATLFAVLQQGVDAYLLAVDPDGTQIRFVHALTREAVHDGILPLRRRGWHRMIGEQLLTSRASDPDAVAYHFQQAGDPRAVEWLISSGERARRAYSWRTAAERLDAARRLIEDAVERRRESGWLQYRIGRLLRLADPVEGMRRMEDAERIAVETDDPILAAFAGADRGLILASTDVGAGIDQLAAGITMLDELPANTLAHGQATRDWVTDALPPGTTVGPHLTDSQPPPLPGDIRRGVLVYRLTRVGRLAEALAIGEAFVAQTAATLQRDELVASAQAAAYAGLGGAYALLGRPADARHALERARAIHHSIADHSHLGGSVMIELAAVTLPFQTENRAERSRLAHAMDEVLRSMSGALADDAPTRLGYLPLLVLEGAWSEARSLLDANMFATPGGEWERHILAQLARHQGEPELAWAQTRAVLPEGPATEPGDCLFAAGLELQRHAADLALDTGDLPLALQWIDARDRWLSWSGSVWGRAESALLRARYDHALGRRADAYHHARASIAHATDPRQPLALLAAHRLLGQLDSEAGRYADAQQNLHAALDLAAACVAPFERALMLLALAELHVATSDTDEASALLREARTICDGLDAAPALASIDTLDAQIIQRTTATPRPFGLTAREVEVLRLIAEGKPDREIGALLFVSHRTVSSHVTSILNKLGVSSRSAAVAVALRQGIL